MSDNPNEVGKVFNLTGGGGGNGSLKLESIAITKLPIKTTYKSGQSFDPTGMVVTASYGYGLTSDVTGYTVSPAILTDDVKEVTITYTEGRVTKTTSTPVTVEKVLVSIEVTTPPTKTTYNYLEKFEPNGMAVTAEFSDGSTAAATGYSYPTTEFSTLGTQTINLDYTFEGVTKSTTLDVTVNPIEVPAPTQKDDIFYTGAAATPTWNGYDSIKMTLTGDTTGVNADTYTAKFSLVYGYVFPNGTRAKEEFKMDSVLNLSVILSIIGVLVVLTNIIVQVVKKVTWGKLPTNILAVIVSMALTLMAFFAYCQIKAITVVWYMVVAAVVLGFLVSYAAMFGFDKLKEALTELNKQ